MAGRDSKDSPVSTGDFEVEVDLTASQRDIRARKGKKGRSRKQTALLAPDAIEGFQRLDRPTDAELPSLEGLGEGERGAAERAARPDPSAPERVETAWPPKVSGPPVKEAAQKRAPSARGEQFSLRRSAQVGRPTVLMSDSDPERAPLLWAVVVFLSVLLLGLIVLGVVFFS